MELWIRSQDKNSLIKVENIYSDIFAEDGFYKIFNMPGEDVLGKYKTKERAVEVLDEIQKLLKPQLMIKDGGKIIGTFEASIIREDATYEIKELSTYVYEMPKE